MPATGSSLADSVADRFYGRALARIRRFILVLGGVGAVVCLLRFGVQVATGFLIGTLISYVNHVWLERVVDALGQRITSGQSSERGGIIVFRTVLRYGFIALGAYVIFRVSQAGLYGFLAGICVTIAALACEAVVEIYTGLRRDL